MEEQKFQKDHPRKRFGGKRVETTINITSNTAPSSSTIANNEPNKGVSSGRLDELEWQLIRRLPPRFRTSKNDVYVTKKTKFAAQFARCKALLDTKCDAIVIHALGHAIGRALNLALMLEDAMLHSIKLDVLTSSVQVTDDVISLIDADDEANRQRNVSAVHILVSRV